MRKTPQGFLVAPANLTRIGVFTYRNADGSITRELRHPDEVFKSDSLASLGSAPITVDHPGEVTASNWRSLAVGHVEGSARKDGKFVAADVRITDADTVAAVERKDLVELSCGYRCDIDPTSGEYAGERYDAIQRNILYNHVALGPSGWGRAGSEVRLRMDANGVALWPTPLPSSVSDNNQQSREDALAGENALLKSEVSRLTTELAAANDPKRLDALVANRVDLLTSARSVLGGAYKADGQSDHQVRVAVLAKLNPALKTDGQTPDFVRGAFDAALSLAQKADAALASTISAAGPVLVPTTVHAGDHQDSSGDAIEKARLASAERGKNAWKAAK